jgi:hypothetical protein
MSITKLKNLLSPMLFLSLIIAAGLVTGCGRVQTGGPEAATDITVNLAIEPAEPAVGPSQLVITLTDPTGQPINNATLEIEGNMTHAGMVPVLAEATAGQGGRYTVPFEWTMGGDWIVTVKAILPDGQAVSQEFPVTVQ